jgi:hypothetical protein
MSFRIPLAVGLLVGFVTSAAAQAPLRLQISDGRVTLHAENVPIRTILAEWARVGGTTILNGDGIAGAPLTLELEGVPERRALDIVLRSVSGYVVGARQPGKTGASIYDRIVILPTSVAPRNPAPTPGVAGSAPGIIRPVMPRPDDQDANDDPDTAQGNDGVPLARPVPLPRPVVGGVPMPMPGNPPITVVPDNEPPQQPPTVVGTPTNPFGLPPGASTRPGVITPPPPPQPPAQQQRP